MPVGGVVNSTIIEPVQILYRGHSSALFELVAAAKTVAVTPLGGLDGTNANIPTNRPLGVLSGMVATSVTLSGELWGAGVCSKTTAAIGIFSHGYEGNAFENSPGVASDKVTILRGQPVLKVYIFETIAEDGSTAITYALGEKLYSSAAGLLTNVASTEATIIGRVSHVPTTAEDWLGVECRI